MDNGGRARAAPAVKVSKTCAVSCKDSTAFYKPTQVSRRRPTKPLLYVALMTFILIMSSVTMTR